MEQWQNPFFLFFKALFYHLLMSVSPEICYHLENPVKVPPCHMAACPCACYFCALGSHSLQCLHEVGEEGWKWIMRKETCSICIQSFEHMKHLDYMKTLFDETQNVWALILSTETVLIDNCKIFFPQEMALQPEATFPQFSNGSGHL